MNRRSFILGLTTTQVLSLAGTRLVLAQEDDTVDVPFVSERADFAGAWQREDDGMVLASFVSPKIPDKYIAELSSIAVPDPSAIHQYISARARVRNSNFIDWFNAVVSGRKYWETKRISADRAHANFEAFWKAFLLRRSMNLLDVFTHMAIFINEVEGNLEHRSEVINSVRHKTSPGISYLFDALTIKSTLGTWTKQSYNKKPNKTCLECFNDPVFTKAFSHLRFGKELFGTKDTVWASAAYPKNEYPVSPSAQDSGAILECDFFKFRGRGIIQTTWRANYAALMEYILGYEGDSAAIQNMRDKYASMSIDDSLTASSNDDWDAVFKDDSRELLTYAVWRHAEQSNYWLSSDPDVVNGTGRGSIIHFGNSLGGRGYGQRLRARVFALTNSLLR